MVSTGHIQADDEPAFGFRIGGRVIERPVNIGDRVKAGQVLAKLDPESELSACARPNPPSPPRKVT